MKIINMTDIRSFNPCYDPSIHLPEDWSGSINDLLCYEHIPARDRLWVVVRQQFLSDSVLREYGLACARLVEHLSNDHRVSDCNAITESFNDGEATSKQLYSARAAADAAYASDAVYASAAARAAAAAAYASDAAYASAAARAASAAARASDAAYASAAAAAYASDAAYASAAAAAAAAAADVYVPYAGSYAGPYPAAPYPPSVAREEMEEQQCQLLLHVMEVFE